MSSNQHNTELNPTVSLLRSLEKLLDFQGQVNAVLLYMPLHSAMVNILHLSKGSYTNIALTPKELEFYPDRSCTNKEKVVIKPIHEIQNNLYRFFSKNSGLFPQPGEDKTGNFVAVFQFLSASDNKWDYLFLLVDKDLKDKIISNFDSVYKKNNAKPEHEILIHSYLKMTYPFFNEIVNSAKLKLEQLSKHNSYIRRLLSYNEQLKSEISHLKQKKEGETLREFEYLLIKAENTYKKNFSISDDTKKFIVNYSGNLENLKKSFEKAIEDVVYLNTDQNIVIKPIHIELTDFNVGNENGYKTKKQEKAADFLQRYEEAAQAAYDSNQEITINTIAVNIKPQPVSPPAISHTLKKYRSEIISLLNSSATNWVILRTYFKPIKSLAEKFTN
ncbi:MAG: hypothetical protein JXR31_03550 [Prolixibacteraceae bacterium]|nr:hypothetical protein [Prolixibacteraceae bacterium]